MSQEQRAEGVRRRSWWARLKAYFRDSWLELGKVIWPKGEEVLKMSGLVVVVVFLVGLFIVIWDQVLLQITRPLYGR